MRSMWLVVHITSFLTLYSTLVKPLEWHASKHVGCVPLQGHCIMLSQCLEARNGDPVLILESTTGEEYDGKLSMWNAIQQEIIT